MKFRNLKNGWVFEPVHQMVINQYLKNDDYELVEEIEQEEQVDEEQVDEQVDEEQVDEQVDEEQVDEQVDEVVEEEQKKRRGRPKSNDR